MNPAEHQILTRIGFAERWLQRAREECLEGDMTRGLLTVVLADAEVRRLLQLATPRAPRRRLRPVPLFAAVGLLMATIAALQVGALDLRAAALAPAALAPGLSLRAGTGILLQPVEAAAAREVVRAEQPARLVSASRPTTPVRPAPAAARRTPARAVAHHTPAPLVQPAGIPSHPATPAAAPPGPAVAQPSAPFPAVAAAPVQSADSTLTTADLLDLVIIADRTLRRGQP